MILKELILKLQSLNPDLDIAVAINNKEGILLDIVNIEGVSGGEEVVFLDVNLASKG